MGGACPSKGLQAAFIVKKVNKLKPNHTIRDRLAGSCLKGANTCISNTSVKMMAGYQTVKPQPP